MGLGADIIATLQWPVLGDPFALVSLLFPMAALETAFATMYVLRMLVAGVAAALYFRVMGAKPLPSAIGAVAYVFTTFLFIQGRHPYFINAMVFLPILLMSLEWALQNRRRWVLVAVVFVTVAANFYFFYILTIVAVIYAVARYFELAEKEERWKRLLPTALRVGGYYTLGVILAAPLLLPAVAAVMQTTRIASDVPLEAFHRSLHYGEMVIALTTSHSAHNSTFLGFAWLGLLAAAALLVRRRYGALNFMNVAYIALVGFPVFGRVFNGMSFSSNRFAFSWGLFLALAAALLLSEDRPLDRRELAAMGVFLGGYSALLLMTPDPFAVDILVPTLAGAATLRDLRAGARARPRDPVGATCPRTAHPAREVARAVDSVGITARLAAQRHRERHVRVRRALPEPAEQAREVGRRPRRVRAKHREARARASLTTISTASITVTRSSTTPGWFRASRTPRTTSRP